VEGVRDVGLVRESADVVMIGDESTVRLGQKRRDLGVGDCRPVAAKSLDGFPGGPLPADSFARKADFLGRRGWWFRRISTSSGGHPGIMAAHRVLCSSTGVAPYYFDSRGQQNSLP
jgi:hypothetical protein